MKPHPCAIPIICFLLFLPLSASAAMAAEPTSFAALYRYWHEPSDTVLDEARITYSSQGLRVEQLTDDSGNVFIANYAEDAFWFLDRKRHLVHAIPVVARTLGAAGEATGKAPGEETHETIVHMASDVSKDGLSGMSNGGPGDGGHGQSEFANGFLSGIQVEPCKGLMKVSLGESVFQGRPVQRWSCMLYGEIVEEHWYTTNPGVVVRISTPDGFVSELTEIHRRHAASAYFRPPSHYRSVEIEELVNPAVPISSYEEKSNGQPSN